MSMRAVVIGSVSIVVAAIVVGAAEPPVDKLLSTGMSAQLKTCREASKAIEQMSAKGEVIDAGTIYVWSRRLMECERDLAVKNSDRMAAVMAHVERMRSLRESTYKNWVAGKTTRLEYLDVQFHYNEAVSSMVSEKTNKK